MKKYINWGLAALTLLGSYVSPVGCTSKDTETLNSSKGITYNLSKQEQNNSLGSKVNQSTEKPLDTRTRQQATPIEIFKVGGNGKYTSISTAARYALGKPGSEIWVAEGTYFEQAPIELRNNISLKGGFTKDFTSRGGLETVIDGTQKIYGSCIEITGSASLDKVTVQRCESMDGSGVEIFLNNGLTNDVTITNNIIKNNTNYSRGEGTVATYVFYDTKANLKIQGNIIHDNTYGIGTAIYVVTEGLPQDGQTAVLEALIENNEIYNNTNTSSGPGIMVEIDQASQAKVQMNNNNIHNNTTLGSGGGIFIAQRRQPSQATILIENTKIANNKAGVGGGIDVLDYTNTMELILKRVIVENNETSAWGGVTFGSDTAITTRSNINVLDSIIRGNKSGSWGGGIYSKGKINLNISNTLITDNTATGNNVQEGRGGGLYVEGDSLVNINNATIFNNTASGGYSVHGGGIYSYVTNTNINNSIVYGNNLTVGTLNFGKDIYAGGPVIAKYSNIGSVSYNDGQGLDSDGMYTEESVTNQDPKFDSLESFILSKNSPMINTGDPITFDECSPTGIEEGVSDKGYTGGKNCEILTPGRKGDVNGDGRIDWEDVVIIQQAISGKNPVGIRRDYSISGADVNGDGKIGIQEAIYTLQKTAGLR